MAKYSYELKLKAVQAFLNGDGGYGSLCEKYNISARKSLRVWVSASNTFGADGLMRSRKKQTYTFEFKLHVVELYLTTEVSYQELALQIGINNPSLLCKWVSDYRIAGPDALKQNSKGRPPKMTKPKQTKQEKKVSESYESEYHKRLEEENLKLRIENAYLKELRRLRLEGKPLKKKRE